MYIAHALHGYEDTIAYLTKSALCREQLPALMRCHGLISKPTRAPLELHALCAKLIDELSSRMRKSHFHIGRELFEMDWMACAHLPK